MDVPEPLGICTTPMTAQFLQRHRENDAPVVRHTPQDPCASPSQATAAPPPIVAAVARAKAEKAAAEARAATASKAEKSAAAAAEASAASASKAEKAAPADESDIVETPSLNPVTGPVRPPTVRLRLYYPPGMYPSEACAKRFRLNGRPPTLHESAEEVTDGRLVATEAHVWPSGRDWMPSTHNWGTRNPEFFGCGKCRWRPRGCRGCIAAASGYDYVACVGQLGPGAVALPPRGVDEDCDKEDGRYERLQALLRSVAVTREGVVDTAGAGVIALRDMRVGEVLLDASVVYVARPSEYARAHLPQYCALEHGANGYFRLREPAFGHASLTYFVNEARHLGAEDGTMPNVKYRIVRPRDGGIALGLEVLVPIATGTELLSRYNQILG